MKKIFIKITLVTALLVSFSGCKLDTDPTTEIPADKVFEKTKDVEKVINGTWVFLMETFNSYANPGYGSVLRAGDAMGNDVVVNRNKYGFGSQYTFKSLYGKVGTGTLSWKLAYGVINNMNEVITKVDASQGPADMKARLKGQAYALRGFMYLHLASNYSFAINQDPNAVCAPIYIVPFNGENSKDPSPASNVSEVYAQSILDLEEALKLIPATYKGDMHEMTTQVVLGFLSRATLYSRDWAKAKDYSEQLLASRSYLMNELEYKDGFNDSKNGEWILAHRQTNDQNDATYQFHYLDAVSDISFYHSFNADPYFRDLFNDGDYRKDMINWTPDPGDDPKENGYIWMKYSKFRFKPDGLADIVLMRTSEIYLINAEAKARLGEDGNAVSRLNELKAARKATLTPAGLSGQALLDDIFLERRKELFAEGFAMVDIIRNQQVVKRLRYPDTTTIPYTYIDDNGISHTVNMLPQGHSIINLPDNTQFVANSKYYLYRIPDVEERENKRLYEKYPKLSIFQ